MKFLFVLAIIFGCLSTGLLLLRILGKLTYNDLDALRDSLQGRVATFPITYPGIIAIVCWCWVIFGGK